MEKRNYKNTILSAILLFFCVSPVEPAYANEDMGGIALSDLLNLEVSVASRTLMAQEEAPSVISVISGREIQNMGAKNLLEVMRIVPGFDFYRSHAVYSSSGYIRGMRGDGKYILMLNGHGIKSEALGIFFDKIPLAGIRKIEIIRGPGSALYGAGAYLGVINIILKEGGSDASRLSSEVGSYDRLNSYSELSYRSGSLKAYLLADYNETEGYDGMIVSDAATASSVLASHAPGKLTEGGHHSNLQANLSYHHFRFTGMFQQMDYEVPVGIAGSLTDRNECADTFVFGEIGYDMPLQNRGNLLIKGYYDYHRFKRVYEIFSYETGEMDMHTGFPPGEGLFGSPLYKNTVAGAEITADYEILPGIGAVCGFSYEHRKVYDVRSYANHNITGRPLELDGMTYPAFPYQYFPAGMTDISEEGNWLEEADRRITALYMQGTFDVKNLFSLENGVEYLALTAGLRYDHYDDVGQTLNPRFGLIFAPREKIWFKGLYGTAFRAPGWSEMYAKNNPAYVGNGDVEPENVRTIEFQTMYHFTDNIQSSLTFFHILAEDLIEGSQGTFRNEGEFASQGIEAEMRLNFGRYRYAWCNVTWQDVKNISRKSIVSDGGQVYTQKDFFPGNIPEFYGSIGLNRDFYNEHLIANLSMNCMGRRKRSEEKMWEGEKLRDKDKRESIDAAFLLNASLIFRNFYKGWEFQVSGYNLLDDEHTVPVAIVSLEKDLPRPGRTFSARISYSF